MTLYLVVRIRNKYNPILFLKKIKKILKKNGCVVLRIPNFKNIYAQLLNESFYKYDYRTSHNFYFSEKNLDLMFKKLNFKIYLKKGFNEYSFNHLCTYLIKNKRVKTNNIQNIFDVKTSKRAIANIEFNKISTSFIYILKN